MNHLVAIEEATLPANLQRGLRAIKERVLPSSAVVALDGNFAIVQIGTLTKPSSRSSEAALADADLPEIYGQPEAALFARVSATFPNGLPYGVITVPYLTRTDGRAVEWQHLNNPNAQAVAQALSRQDIGFWSWDWKGMPHTQPEDLVAVVEWARKCVRTGAQ